MYQHEYNKAVSSVFCGNKLFKNSAMWFYEKILACITWTRFSPKLKFEQGHSESIILIDHQSFL